MKVYSRVLVAFLLIFFAGSGYANKSGDIDLSFIVLGSTEPSIDTVDLSLDVTLINKSNGYLSDISISLSSPVDEDESYGPYLAGGLSQNESGEYQVLFEIPKELNRIFQKKLKYFFKVNYFDSNSVPQEHKFYLVQDNI